MKSFTFFLFLLTGVLMVASVSTENIFSGEEYVVDVVNHCSGNITVLVNASLPIDSNEYNIINCTKLNNTWNCPCDNPFNITLQTKSYTVNTYDFKIEYMEYKDDGQSTSSSSSSGGSYSGGYYIYKKIKKNDTVIVKPIIPVVKKVEPPVEQPVKTPIVLNTSIPINNTTDKTIVVEEGGFPLWLVIIILLLLILVIVLGIKSKKK